MLWVFFIFYFSSLVACLTLSLEILFFSVQVWEESSSECLLQIQLLIALRNFVVALGYQSPICYNILLPVLQKGIDINSPDELNLLEDSMLVSLTSFVLLFYQLTLSISITSYKKVISGGLVKKKARLTFS